MAGDGAAVEDVHVVAEQVGLVHEVRREQHCRLALPPQQLPQALPRDGVHACPRKHALLMRPLSIERAELSL